jgi:undecaprenyl diphosphate synthase
MRITRRKTASKPSPPGKRVKEPSAPPVAHTSVPRHVAIIMDGNGRWAQQRGMSRQQGHRAGTENIRRIIQAFGERGVEVLTLYAFSTENWARPRAEVNALMRLIPRVIRRELNELHKNGRRAPGAHR